MSMMRPVTSLESAGIHFVLRPGTVEKTIVLLHGIGGRASGFEPVMKHWPAGPQILAWDAPGYGQSRPLSSPAPAPQEYAEALALALDALGIKSVDLMGQSLGALFAAAFATRFPDRVRKLVLMCPALGYQTPKGSPLPEALATRLADHHNEGAAAFATKRASRLVHDAVNHPGIVRSVRLAMATIQQGGYGQAMHALAQGDLMSAATALVQPVLLVSGAKDMITPLAGTAKLLQAFQSRKTAPVDMCVIPDAGHAVYLEQTIAVTALAASFFGEPA